MVCNTNVRKPVVVVVVKTMSTDLLGMVSIPATQRHQGF